MSNNQNNDFQQYGFDHYDQAPLQQPGQHGMLERIFGLKAARLMKSPLGATIAILAIGALFANFMLSGTAQTSDQDHTPIVIADQSPYKERPTTQPGNMTVSNRDNTIYYSMNEDGTTSEAAPIKNIADKQASTDTMASFAKQLEEIVATTAITPAPKKKIENLLGSSETRAPSPRTTPTITAATTQTQEIKPAPPSLTLQSTIEKTAQIQTPKKPALTIHRAGSNPETLDFVRSILEKKDERLTTKTSASDIATTMARIEPASGHPATTRAMPSITSGNHFVQLGSVKSASGAESEWGKLQKTFSNQLTGLTHRVKTANLGERGIYYRIQAGPMSRESAKTLCANIKAQKPGGCLVTQ